MRVYVQISNAEQKKLGYFIMKELSKNFVKRLSSTKPMIKQAIATYILDNKSHSKDIESIIEGDLQAELGLVEEEAREAMNKIFAKIIENMDIDVIATPQSNSIKITVIIGAVDYLQLTEMPQAQYISHGSSAKRGRGWSGAVIPWLAWLFYGTPGIKGYFISWGHYVDARSKKALMFKAAVGHWMMPKNYIGTPADNFITRVFQGVEVIIFDEVKRILKNA